MILFRWIVVMTSMSSWRLIRALQARGYWQAAAHVEDWSGWIDVRRRIEEKAAGRRKMRIV